MAVNFMMSEDDHGQVTGFFVKEKGGRKEGSRKKATRFLLHLRVRFYAIQTSVNEKPGGGPRSHMWRSSQFKNITKQIPLRHQADDHRWLAYAAF